MNPLTNIRKLHITRGLAALLVVDNHSLGKYTGDNFAYWSLGHELIFYLLSPFYCGLKKNNLFLLSALLVIVFLLTGLYIFYCQIFF